MFQSWRDSCLKVGVSKWETIERDVSKLKTDVTKCVTKMCDEQR